MIVAIEKNGQIIEDEIVEINRIPYKGNVYDLEVENLHNYVAGGVVVHNSIYRWRGADWRNVVLASAEILFCLTKPIVAAMRLV